MNKIDNKGEKWHEFGIFTGESLVDTGKIIHFYIKKNPVLKGIHEVLWLNNKIYYIGIDFKKMKKDSKYHHFVIEILRNKSYKLLNEEKPYNYIGHVVSNNNGLPFGDGELKLIVFDEMIEWSKQQPYVIEQVEMAKQRQKEAKLDNISSIPKKLQKNRKKIQELQDEINELLKYEEQLTIEYINLCKAYGIPIADLDEIDEVSKTK